MPKSNAQKLAQQKYDQKSYDQILIKVKKGKREEYRQSAESIGLGQMEMIRLAIEEYIKNHTGEDFTAAIKPEAEKLTTEQKRLVEEFNQLPADAQKYFLKAFRAINDQSKGGGNND